MSHEQETADGQTGHMRRCTGSRGREDGEQEQSGGGLADDILQIIAEGLPILVLVPEPALESWRELTGCATAEVQCEAAELQRWWHNNSGNKV